MKGGFSVISKRAENITGHPATFSVACLAIGAWLIWGLFHGFTAYYLDVFITTLETIAIMLLLILQRATNVANESIQLKLNELLRVEAGGARLDIEEWSDDERQEARERDHREAAT